VSLELDERRLAMLGEMGLRIFMPAPPAVPAFAPAPAPAEPLLAVRQAVPAPAPPTEPAPMPARPGSAGSKGVAPSAGVDLLQWDALAQAVADCRACNLCDGRSNAVFGAGDPKADWLIVGDPPDEADDQQGQPFAGPAGKLLDNMLRAAGLARTDNVYISNVLKCRPAGNRNPEPAELSRCEPFLRRQVQLLEPKIIIAMGRFAVQTLLGTQDPVGKLRGRVHDYMGVPVVVTYHPAYLLRNLADKGKAWTDLCLALEVVSAAAR